MPFEPKSNKPISNHNNSPNNRDSFISPTVHNLSAQNSNDSIIQKQDAGDKKKEGEQTLQTASVSQSVQKYTHPDKANFKAAKNRAQSNYDKTYNEYTAYYLKINKISKDSTEEEIWNAFSEANRTELNRLKKSVEDNLNLYNQADADEKQWNKLDSELTSVVSSFNSQKKLKGAEKLNPNLVKALMFSESEMGAGIEYKELIKSIPKDRPKARYHLNLGRVTDANVYNSVVEEFSIPVNWKTNYQAMGNKNDVMLAAGALIQKYEYAKKFPDDKNLKKGQHWFNAVVAYKGISSSGKAKAELVWSLYTTGTHPYTSSKKLF